MPNTDRFSMLERWANGAEAFKDAMETKYGPAPTPPQLPPYTIYDAMLEAIADSTVEVKRLINKKSTTYHSDSVAYVKTVPAGDVHYASLESVGGKTVVWNQLVNTLATDTYTTNGITFTVNADKSITISGTATDTATYMPSPSVYDYFPIVVGHKYYHYAPTNIVWGDRNGRIGGGNTIVTPSYGGTNNLVFFRVFSGNTVNVTFYPMIHDLTLLYGSGNEPSTVAEFQQTFPAQYYPYNAGQLLSAGVTEVVSKKADTTTLATYSIPAEIQALEGYGWSAGSVSNYIDYEAKKFVKRVGSCIVDGTTLYISGQWGQTTSGYACYSINLPFGRNKNGVYRQVIADKFIRSTEGQASMPLYSFLGNSGGVATISFVLPSTVTTVADANTWFANNPTTIYYELDDYVETDISEYLTDDNLIEVEAGGTLTFENANGDNYRIPVPSSETFIVGEP